MRTTPLPGGARIYGRCAGRVRPRGHTDVMAQKPVDPQAVELALQQFVSSSQDLSQGAWNGPVSSSAVVNCLNDGTFSEAISRYAAQHGVDDLVYLWPVCPRGKRHRKIEYFSGTRTEYQQGACPTCDRQADLSRVWLESQPTFAEKYPHLVAYLADPADAQSKEMVAFRCSEW